MSDAVYSGGTAMAHARRGSRWTPIVLLLLLGQGRPPLGANWPQWGGPNRDFTVYSDGLADRWPEDGPSRLWYRELGDGYSGIVYDDGVLYTLYRSDPLSDDERVVALDAETGRTIWEHTSRAPLSATPDSRWGGLGPNATPLIVGPHLFTIGSLGMMHCFDKTSGGIVWTRDLAGEYGAPYPNSGEVGYSASPIAYANLVVVIVGRNDSADAPRGQSLIAFEQANGREVWKSLDFGVVNSSPTLIRIGGRSQLVLHASTKVVGVDPDTGQMLWSIDAGEYTPVPSLVFGGENLLFNAVRAEGQGSSAIRLVQRETATIPEVLWSEAKPTVFISTPVAVGSHLYGATQTALFGLDLTTGEIAWMERGFPNASCIHADGKLITLDENGILSLVTATPEGLTRHARARVTERYSLTAPTLVGRTLYVRDRKHIIALDLGPDTQAAAVLDADRRRRVRTWLVGAGLGLLLAACAILLRRLAKGPKRKSCPSGD